MAQNPNTVGGTWKAESERLTKAMSDLTEKLRIYQEAYDNNSSVIEEIRRVVYAYEKELSRHMMTDLIRILAKRKLVNREQI